MSKLFFLLTVILLSSCGHFPDGTSVWAGGLGIIPFVLGLGSAWFFSVAYRKSKSGSRQQLPNGTVESDEDVKIYKIGEFWYGVALAAALTVVVIAVNLSK